MNEIDKYLYSWTLYEIQDNLKSSRFIDVELYQYNIESSKFIQRFKIPNEIPINKYLNIQQFMEYEEKNMDSDTIKELCKIKINFENEDVIYNIILLIDQMIKLLNVNNTLKESNKKRVQIEKKKIQKNNIEPLIPEILINIDGRVNFKKKSDDHRREIRRKWPVDLIETSKVDGGYDINELKGNLLYIINTYIRMENNIPTLSNESKTSIELLNIVVDFCDKHIDENNDNYTTLINFISVILDLLAFNLYNNQITLPKESDDTINGFTVINKGTNLLKEDKFKICCNKDNMRIANNRNKLLLTLDENITEKKYCIMLDDSDFIGFNSKELIMEESNSYTELFNKTFVNWNNLNTEGMVRYNNNDFGGSHVSFWTKIIPIKNIKNYKNYIADICEDGIVYTNYNDSKDNIMNLNEAPYSNEKQIPYSYADYGKLSPHFNPPFLILLSCKFDGDENVYYLLTFLDLLLTWIDQFEENTYTEISIYIQNYVKDKSKNDRVLFLPSVDFYNPFNNYNVPSSNNLLNYRDQISNKLKGQCYAFSRYQFIIKEGDYYKSIYTPPGNSKNKLTFGHQNCDTSHVIGRLQTFYEYNPLELFIAPSVTGTTFNSKENDKLYSNFMWWNILISSEINDSVIKLLKNRIIFAFIRKFADCLNIKKSDDNSYYITDTINDDIFKNEHIKEIIIDIRQTIQNDQNNVLNIIWENCLNNELFSKSKKYNQILTLFGINNINKPYKKQFKNDDQYWILDNEEYEIGIKRLLNVLILWFCLNGQFESDFYQATLECLYNSKLINRNDSKEIDKFINEYGTYYIINVVNDVQLITKILDINRRIELNITENFSIMNLNLNEMPQTKQLIKSSEGFKTVNIKETNIKRYLFKKINEYYKRITNNKGYIFNDTQCDVYYIGCGGSIYCQKILLLTRKKWNGWDTRIPFYGSSNKFKNMMLKIKDFIIKYYSIIILILMLVIVLIIIYIIKKYYHVSIKTIK